MVNRGFTPEKHKRGSSLVGLDHDNQDRLEMRLMSGVTTPNIE